MGAAQFPVVIGGVAVAVNVAGVPSGAMRLNGPLLTDIYLGKVTRWSDPAIAALNPGLKFPDTAIAVIRRSDGSGTTFNFTAYLSAVSAEWKQKAGSGLHVQWPIGTGAKGNDGVGKAVKATANAIGYLEYAQASQLGLTTALLQNRSGRYVPPNASTFQAAARTADWSASRDFHLLLIDTPGRRRTPDRGDRVRAHAQSEHRPQSRGIAFLRWSLEKGGPAASRLGYVPLPDGLVQQIRAYWRTSFPGVS
jgi:phosphate transport system substrate-binding protein